MSLYQKSVLNKFLKQQDKEAVAKAFKKFSKHFHNLNIQENIRNSKEEQYQEGFLRELFVDVFGYTLNPQPNYNLTTELKNEKGSKKVDGAILKDGKAIGVIELKGTDTKDLEKVRQQAFDYKANHTECVYVITSNFEKLRFYINNAVDFEEFDLFTIDQQRFEVLYLSLAAENIQNHIPLSIKEASVVEQENITKKFYADYSLFKRELFRDLVKKNLRNDVFRNVLTAEETSKADKNIKLNLFKKSQKLIDRFLFIFFAEDRGLLPPNSTHKILEDWNKLKDMDAIFPLYDRFKLYFNYLDTGRKGTDSKAEIFAYNGGLFKPDNTLDSLLLDDELLYKHAKKLSEYDFESQVDVNILGHIFENSLNEIESVNAEIEGTDFDKQKTKRKKDGVFYTPKYITKYIVDNTVGKLCLEKRAELAIIDEEFTAKRQKETKRLLLEKLETYRSWLLDLTICDPACGSGAFLNQALDFLIKEHESVDELQAALLGGAIVFQEIENTILEKNIYGVDLNEESVEIAKLSLWLRTAQPRRKLNDLNNNINCGNSLIDSKAVAGDKAFKWEDEFPEVFKNGGFDVIIGNPPYVLCQPSNTDDLILEFYKNFKVASYKIDLFHLFFEKSIEILKNKGKLGFITPNTYLNNKYIKPLRNFILKNTKVNQVINHEESVFAEASVDVATIILTTGFYENNIIKTMNSDSLGYFNLISEKQQSEWLNDEDNLFNLNVEYPIKFEKCVTLDSICNSYFGIQAYDRKSSISDIKINDNYRPMIDGGDIFRYEHSKPNKFFNFIEEKIKSGGDKSVYENDRIVIRQIGKTPIIGLCGKGIVTSNTLYNIYLKNNNDYDLNYILAILNSKLLKSYWIFKYSDGKQLFPKIKGYQLKALPIFPSEKENQVVISDKVSFILGFTERCNKILNGFQAYLQGEFKIEKLTKKLQSWHDLTFSDFIKELNKAIKTSGGTPLSKLQEMEWMEVFETKKKEALELKSEIDRTDKEIDRLVYELYGLSEEEIGIVEGS